MHHTRWLRHGNPETKLYLKKEISRFMSFVSQTRGCWHWTGCLTSGYGRFNRSAEVGYKLLQLAHRFSWEYFIGPIPDGMQIDHLCRVRNCVNPYHLEVVSCKQNIQRGLVTRSKRYCPKGHPYAGDNLYVSPSNKINCRACHRAHTKAYNKRKMEAK